jgi:type I restriction enzyme S subunit
MKDSGIEWIGEIPENWKVVPIKIAFSEVKTKNTDGAVTNALKFKFGEIVPKTNFDSETDDYVADTILNYTIVEPRMIMINGLNLNYDFKTLRTGLVKEKGIITSAYLALKPIEEIVNAEYATYLFKGYETKMAFHNMGAGIRLTLGFKEFKNQPLLLPPLSEQEAIADFLNQKCAKIDTLIEKKTLLLEEMETFKKSLIFDYVTGKKEVC